MDSKKMEIINKDNVIIVGGGLSGLSLALQISRLPDGPAVLVLEKDTGERPESGFKVGESTVEGGGDYLNGTLGLGEYLEANHFRKSGPRIVTGRGPITERPVFSAAGFASLPSYQLNRGKLENHLISMLESTGVEIRRGCRVLSIDTENRTILYQDDDGKREISGTWIVDASGYPGLIKEAVSLPDFETGRVTACWFRIRGHKVPGSRNPESREIQATTLIPGKDRWFWIIPLPGGNTSVGIVRYIKEDESGGNLSTYEKAMEWLSSEDQELADELKSSEVLDFSYRGDLSYAMSGLTAAPFVLRTGDARGFVDPMYSPGIDFVALANNMILYTIMNLRESGIVPEGFEQIYKMFFRQFYRTCRSNYSVFSQSGLFLRKLYWDTLFYWSTLFPLLRYRLFETMTRAPDPYLEKMLELDDRVQVAFRKMSVSGYRQNSIKSGYFPPPGSVLTDSLQRLITSDSSHFSFEDNLRLLEILEPFAAGEPVSSDYESDPNKNLDRFRMELGYLEGKMDLDHYLMVQRLFKFA